MTRKTIHARTAVVAVAAALAIAAGAVGCGGGDKAGGSGGQVTLRIGSDDTPGRPSGVAVEEFARQANELSGGRIRIEPVWQVAGRSAPAWDQRVARMVAGGELDMGLIPARAWDTEGVTSLRALHAPFLVTSHELVERIVTSDLAAEMLAGLDRAGVVGLALLPEDLRHPFGFGGSLRSLGDFQGQTVRAPRSEVAYDTLRSLGATPTDVAGSAFPAAVADGSVTAAESGFAISGSLPRPATATANVTLYPKVNSLVVDEEAWSELTDEQRDTLREAARRTLGRILETTVAESEAARAHCERGGRVVLADEADVAAMRKAVQPVYAELEHDAATKAVIGRIQALKDELPPAAAPAECDPPAGSTDQAAGGDDPSVLNGVWRMHVSFDEGIAAGLPPDVAAHELGLQTIRMEDGRYDWRWRARDGDQRCPGTYAVSGDLVIFTDEGDCAATWEAAFELSGRTLDWSRARSNQQGDVQEQTIRELLHGKPWRRIAEVRSSEPAFPEGVYRADIPRSFLIERGIDATTADTNSGLMTMTFKDGRWLHHSDSPTNEPDCGGTYAVEQGRVSVTVDPGPECGSAAGGELFSAEWRFRDRELRFLDVRSGEGFHLFARVFWGGKPWRKIG